MSTEHDEPHSAVKVFWAEIPPSEHLVQIYGRIALSWTRWRDL
jgi:hypothetical protein